MSTTVLPGDLSSRGDAKPREDALTAAMWKCIDVLASLKLTCVLFLLGMFIVFVGSLAQARRDVWLVVGQYFRTYVAWIDVADFFPPAMFPSLVDFKWDSLGVLRMIPFPGGWTIGWIMLANLTAAHLLRFKIRASGGRLLAGLMTTAVGAMLTMAVVIAGNAQTLVKYDEDVADRIWYLMLGVLGVASVIPLAVAFVRSSVSKPERLLLGLIGVVLGGVLTYFIAGGEAAQLNVESTRILWQLLKGVACAVVMLIGCNLLFGKRGGIMLLHLGVALLMFSELQVGFYAKENMLTLKEGQTSSFMRDTRERELAIVHRNDGRDKVVAIPEARLVAAGEATDPANKVIEFDGLPFLVRVENFLRNSRLRPMLPDDDKQATKGLGTFAAPVELDPVTGMDDSHDMSSLRITLLDRESGRELETLLCAQDVSEMRSVPIAEQATVNGDDYQFYLRFQRNYKDYEVELLDVSRTNYVGTSTPRDYRSKIIIRDDETGEAEEYALWMNNPLRYKGETFYQSGYNELPDGTEMTTLSVVRNTGWMLPYIACMIVAVGMFAQFGQTLGRYLARFERGDVPGDAAAVSTASGFPTGIRKSSASEAAADILARVSRDAGPEHEQSSIWPVVVPLFLVLLSAGWLASKARTPEENAEVMNLYSFAQVPVAWKGRPQPVDSFARTQLLMTSHKSTFKGELSAGELDHPDRRAKILARIEKYWPSVRLAEFDEFSGEYNDWIEKIMKLTSSGREAVEERVRDVMVERMSAVRWFLDVAARPELAKRHRVIKIDDDQILSLLGLEKRSGLTYSVEEIQKNLEELQSINREGLKLEMADQQHRMTQLQRRVVELFRTVGRVDSLQNIFLVRDSEGLLDSVVKAWWVLNRLGDSPAIMAVPTGSENEQRSWETLIAASALRNVSQEFRDAGLENRKDVVDYVQNRLPRKLVADAISGSVTILKSSAEAHAKETGEELADDAVQQKAKDAAATMEDPFLRKVLSIIAKSEPGATADEMLADVDDAELQQIASERVSSEMFQVFEELRQNSSDKRLAEIRANLQAVGSDDESALASKMNDELLRVVLDDLDARVGGLIYGKDNADAFETGAAAMVNILKAWREGDVQKFNDNVTDYRTYLATHPLPHVDESLLSEEAFFNYFEPFMKAIYLYLPVLVMSFLSWIVWPKTLRRSGVWLMLLAFVVHTAALLLRMHISGRPPVTNLYSSAIFIGWAVVGAAFIVELLLKNGIGNILGSSVGMATLMIAHYLARDEGDTLGVMQAVLDTQFWLATHVVCITLGYAATFLAGVMAIAYCFQSSLGSKLSQSDLPKLGKMIYGVLCFAVFFSLVGTVLGGLWADDSWGRFWGWDPKENGAMLIVMWNALILHARWDKMVRDYGTAVLAMFGNIVTAWSWFGVNELKAGLHTYGFTDGRLYALKMFFYVQIGIIAAAMIWRAGRSQKNRIEPV
ncbi:MAG: cytochrome c biogenesis protein CcsA [Planctomycetaceae bacterium]